MSITDQKTGEQLRDEGTARVAQHYPDWSETAISALSRLPPHTEGTGEQLIRLCGLPDPPDGHLVGSVFLKASRLGLLINTGWVRPMVKPESHGRKSTVWRVPGPEHPFDITTADRDEFIQAYTERVAERDQLLILVDQLLQLLE